MLDKIDVFTQSSIRIKGGSGTVYIDPFQMKEELHDADYILITHDHYDHFSVDDIKKVAKMSTILVVPARMEDDAKELANDVASIVTVKPGVYKEISGLEIETIPAYNTVKPFHPRRAEWVGYILRVDGKRIYVAGDTDVTEEALSTKCDIALVPVGGTYTMTAEEAAKLVEHISPRKYAIPTHYQTVVGSVEDAIKFKELLDGKIEVNILM